MADSMGAMANDASISQPEVATAKAQACLSRRFEAGSDRQLAATTWIRSI